mmetsp:Transcript_97947/g.281780  ORF Transcript_97947/g.281780 Transcript_97947/m.281780 type:complete len:405 (-) Transcript_97947:285-1499(-)
MVAHQPLPAALSSQRRHERNAFEHWKTLCTPYQFGTSSALLACRGTPTPQSGLRMGSQRRRRGRNRGRGGILSRRRLPCARIPTRRRRRMGADVPAGCGPLPAGRGSGRGMEGPGALQRRQPQGGSCRQVVMRCGSCGQAWRRPGGRRSASRGRRQQSCREDIAEGALGLRRRPARTTSGVPKSNVIREAGAGDDAGRQRHLPRRAKRRQRRRRARLLLHAHRYGAAGPAAGLLRLVVPPSRLHLRRTHGREVVVVCQDQRRCQRARLRAGSGRRARRDFVRRRGGLHLNPLAADLVVRICGHDLLHSLGALGTRQEAHEAEASRPAGCRVHHYDGVGHRPKLPEVVGKVGRDGALREAADEDLVRAGHCPLHIHFATADLVRALLHGRLRASSLREGHIAEAA